MKKIILALSASFCLLIANAQVFDNTIKQRTINVNGSAQLEITPDEIYVQVELREYNKKNGEKVTLNPSETIFYPLQKALVLLIQMLWFRVIRDGMEITGGIKKIKRKILI